MQLIRERCEAVAAAAGLHLSWTALAERPPATAPDPRADEHLAAQFEAAVRTACIRLDALPLCLVFVLNDDGHPQPAQDLVRADLRGRITQGNFIAACEITGPATPAGAAGSGSVIWVETLRRADVAHDPYRNGLKSLLFRRYPVLLDRLRQRRTDIVNRRLLAEMARQARHQPEVFLAPFRPGGAPPANTAPASTAPVSTAPVSTAPSILFCLYWLDFGGAEAFAISMMQAAKAAGYRVLVACDEAGRQQLLGAAAACADAVYLLGAQAAGLAKEEGYLRIIRLHRPDLIHIHHSWAMYRALPVVRTLGLVRGVIDTTHILEHRYGGLVRKAALYSAYVDCHHVISQDLADFYAGTAAISPARLRLGRLHDLSAAFTGAADKWAAPPVLNIAFVGRFVQQKRPYVFVAIARRLMRRFGAGRFSFSAVGEGPLRPGCEAAANAGLPAPAVTFLPGGADVHALLAAAHVLLIPSDNEGLTLVAYEAIRAGCLVISCDVGAQRELVADELLVPRHTGACVGRMTKLVGEIAAGRLDVPLMLQRQEAKLRRVLADPTGTDVCLAAYRGMLRPGDADVRAA